MTVAAWALRAAALGCLTGACFLLHPAIGLVATAASLFVLVRTLTELRPRR